jgi:hypothetical protein
MIRLTPGYGTIHGLFTGQKLVEERGKRDSANTKKTRDKLGMNVGAGPILDMCEDLGWFKEAKPGSTERRPVIYEDIYINSVDCVVLEAR